MAVPYMGSKRKSADKIYQTIKNFNPEGKILVDLFCGGFAISEKFIDKGWSVISNDKNKYVVALIKHTIEGNFNDKVFTPEFIDREKFFDVVKNTSKYDDWFVGYVQCIWSFGNTQKTYLFGKDVEPYKKSGHELVVNKNPELILKLIPSFPKKYIDGILSLSDWHKRRIALVKVSKALKNRILELQRLQQLQQLQQLQRLERLQQLQRLERLQQLQQLERITLYSDDYKNIKIPKGAVVYCDPPYQGTAEYSEGGFNHKEFWKYVRELSKTNNVYISEYKAPDDFTEILKFPQKSTLQGGNQKHNNQPDECLFTILTK